MPNTKETELVLTTIKEIRALTDPYRQKIMDGLKRIGRPATAKEVAESIGEPPSKVHYHMGVLMEYGIVEQDHTEMIHGITAKYLKITDRKIQIKGDENQGSEVMNAVNFFFEKGRRKYIEAMEILRAKGYVDGETKLEGYMTQVSVYLTEEEVKELTEFMDNLSRSPKPATRRYILFSAIIPGEEE